MASCVSFSALHIYGWNKAQGRICTVISTCSLQEQQLSLPAAISALQLWCVHCRAQSDHLSQKWMLCIYKHTAACPLIHKSSKPLLLGKFNVQLHFTIGHWLNYNAIQTAPTKHWERNSVRHKPLHCKSASKNSNILEGLILKLLGQQGQPCCL